ncbi:MFS transporter [Roseiarcaceae bacterium H3SJ34-1]|uniref:MFS transporter n=1 Tax=Terripilifer ovatus TaxID=3032367 RepID=UPI003AB9A6EA|nr:MFS transporter [Roseiarcaceae bacterium H3SJ34-1]
MSSAQRTLAFGLIVCGTVLGIAATDLVLPAIPSLPQTLHGTPAQAQFVLAAYVAGTGAGLLAFGELGARMSQRRLLFASLLLFAATSFAAVLAPSINALIAIRLVQGAAGSAAAVFAPGIIRALYPGTRAVGALGRLGSIEALVPALAPVAGAWLLSVSDWKASFVVVGALALLLAIILICVRRSLPSIVRPTAHGSYLALLTNAAFLRLALSQACTLGGLLVVVFGAPAIIVSVMKGSLVDFIIMQVTGVVFFIIGANASHRLVTRYGAERTILGGSILSAFGGCGILAYALVGGGNPVALALLFIPMNLGLGFRGPPGFLHAVLASNGDDSRGAALVILAILLITALGTAIAAPLITIGLIPVATIAACISCSSVLILMFGQR